MGLLRLLHGIARQIGAQDPSTGSDVTQVGDSVNNALRVNQVDSSGAVQGLTLLPSAARTATTTTADQANTSARGVIVYLNVTAASGTGGLTLGIQIKDPASGVYRQVYVASVAVTAITSSGPKVYVLYPGQGAIVGDSATVVCPVLGSTWRVVVTAGDSSSYTYSVAADVLR